MTEGARDGHTATLHRIAHGKPASVESVLRVWRWLTGGVFRID